MTGWSAASVVRWSWANHTLQRTGGQRCFSAQSIGRDSGVVSLTLTSFAAWFGNARRDRRASWPTPQADRCGAATETTKIRLIKISGICIAPQYVVEELLQSEGFTEVQYVETVAGARTTQALASGEVHLTLSFAAPAIIQVDAGEPIVMLAGVHVGCFELFGTDRVHTIRDLKGKTVAVQALGSSRHVVVNSSVDRPWSQYFCCLAAGNREFVRKHPIATKRALRALLKATDVCALEPERVARFLVDKGYTRHYDYAFQAVKDTPYDKWREYEAEDTVRFYALRLHEAGMIKSSPQKIIAQGTDWRFLNALKKELKG